MRHPSMVDLLSESATHWRPAVPSAAPRVCSVVTLSRLPGAQGDEVARSVAERLGYRLFDREIVSRIAESAHTPEFTVEGLDERDRPALADWLCGLTLDHYQSPYAYREHLKRVLTALARVGEAVIVGRGAHLVLPEGTALRVLIVAPLPYRIEQVAQSQHVGATQAELWIRQQEAERRAFLHRHFGADLMDPTVFDLVLNTARVGISGATQAVCCALQHVPVPEVGLPAP